MTATISRQRLADIRERLAMEGQVSATRLAAEFSVSEDTIRRDLRLLAAEGYCERVYGGAIRPKTLPSSFTHRRDEQTAVKRILGRLAAELVQPGETIFIDAGSTNLEIARHLPRLKPLTLVTNAPAIAEAAASPDGPDIVLIGGRFDANLGSCLGGKALRDIEEINPSRAYIGTCALSSEGGLSAFSAEEAELKAAIARRSARVVIAVTRDKFGYTAPFSFAGLDALDQLVTDECEHDLLRDLKGRGVNIITAGRQPDDVNRTVRPGDTFEDQDQAS
ncbi:DeoR/GlpR family DNA-binding transcription regulator [Fulvimarina sp. MAC3]|uniref:DeoR/GlpR family DNA-binding transcription regulator n=1 Tax=Fulvimarina sp. MAC3 TaxID=3148887 RepID=UPI0031FC96A1